MARNTRRSRGLKKLQPAPLTMYFASTDTVAAGAVETYYVDLALCASILNRRGYKQEHGDWGVSAVKFTGSFPGNIVVSTAPNTWSARNAYTKARALWNEMNDQVEDTNPSIAGKYADFKIGLDSYMLDQNIQQLDNAGVPTSGTILTPRDSNGLLTTADFTDTNTPKADWDYSTIQVPNDPASGVTTEYKLHLTGASDIPNFKMGIIQGYGLSRARPQLEEPNTPDVHTNADWMTSLFDDGENYEEIKEDLIEDNDRPPYAVGSPGGGSEFYPGGANELTGNELVDLVKMTGMYDGSGLSQGTSCGFMARHGLIRIDFQNGSETTAQNLVFQIHLVPGAHRGYMVEEV